MKEGHRNIPEAVSMAATAIRGVPMSHGGLGVGLFAIVDAISLLYSICYGQCMVHVYLDGVRLTATPLRKPSGPFHRFRFSYDHSGHSWQLRVEVCPMLPSRVYNGPNLLEGLFCRKGVLEALIESCREHVPDVKTLKDKKARKGSPSHSAVEKFDPGFWRGLDFRLQALVNSFGEKKYLTVKSGTGDNMASFVLVHRVPVTRQAIESKNILAADRRFNKSDYQYRYVLTERQINCFDGKPELLAALAEGDPTPHFSNLDYCFQTETATAYFRKDNTDSHIVCGKRGKSREAALNYLRECLQIKTDTIQVYVPIHVDGRVVFVVAFHLPASDYLQVFNIYALIVPALSQGLRQSVFETALAADNFDRCMTHLCGKELEGRERLIRTEGLAEYRSQSEERTNYEKQSTPG
ncbi:MAG: hypothetical protein JST35_02780 [Armatimonadetes bacterium]|nr:hypothetical protein [Armatimonadota bacterium]